MSATKEDIRKWLKEGISLKCTHVVIARDDFDMDNYPMYVYGKHQVDNAIKGLGTNMQSLEEVYDLSKDIEEQLQETRTMRVPK